VLVTAGGLESDKEYSEDRIRGGTRLVKCDPAI
jgi:hypothetical protein